MIFIFIIGLVFFGYGTVILFRKRNYKPAIGSLAFSIIFIIGIFSVLNTSKVDETQQLLDDNTTQEQPIQKEVSIQKEPVVETKEQNSEEKVELTDAEQGLEDTKNRLNLKIQKIIDSDFTFDTSLKKLELNNNLGTDNTEDYIALIYLSYDQPHSEETTKKWIDEYTSHLAASLTEETDITSLAIFWETPRFKDNWNTAKFNLTKKEGEFYFDSENYDRTVFK